MKSQAMYIACTVWGKNPDDLEEKSYSDKEVAGRDKPIDPALIRGLL